MDHGRRGTLWMDRFKSVLVEDGEALRTMALCIDSRNKEIMSGIQEIMSGIQS